jgi:hypothetical protein
LLLFSKKKRFFLALRGFCLAMLCSMYHFICGSRIVDAGLRRHDALKVPGLAHRNYGFLLAGFILLAGVAPAHAAALPGRQAGMWQSSTVVTMPDGTKAQGGQPVVTVSCVDALNDQKFFLINGSACSSLDVSGQGSVFSINGTCSHAGKPVTVHETLTYADPQTVELVGTVDTGGGPIRLDSQIKYAGACVAGMQPGDEGSLDANGNFDKTDNINDFQNR